jgi:ATP-dependent DNA helicase RecQ
LNYFGEKTSLKYCGNCDRCSERREEPEKATEQPPERPPERRESHVGERQELSEEELVVIQKTLSCVARMRGQYERSMVIAVLRGSEKQRLLDAGLDRLSTYGLLKGFQRKDLYQIFELLDIDDCIRTHLGSRCVSLTERGRKVMKREVLPGFHSLGLPGLVTPVPEKRKKPAAETEAYDEDLYRALRELRYGLATEQGLPAYMIFSDRTLREMSRRCPSTEAEMLAVQGVGPKIFRKYGHAFLSAIQNYVRLQGKRDEEDEAPEDAGVSEPDSGRYVVARTTEGHALTPSETQKQVLALIAEGWRLERIAEKLWMTLPAVIREVLAMSEKGVRIRVEEMLPSPRIEKIKAALPDQLDRVSLRALREKLPESVEPWEIQLVLQSERANRASTP